MLNRNFQSVKMSQKQYAIPQGSQILVTGANGYIGSNIVDLLLDLGFRVRGTVRAEKPWLNELFEKKYGKDPFETVIVPGSEKEGIFDDVLNDVTGIVHVVCASHPSLYWKKTDVVVPGIRRVYES
jgi:nucleoside-diphosphate-sugar epimerase